MRRRRAEEAATRVLHRGLSYAAIAKLLEAGESARQMIERGLSSATIATGLILPPVTGALSPPACCCYEPRTPSGLCAWRRAP